MPGDVRQCRCATFFDGPGDLCPRCRHLEDKGVEVAGRLDGDPRWAKVIKMIHNKRVFRAMRRFEDEQLLSRAAKKLKHRRKCIYCGKWT